MKILKICVLALIASSFILTGCGKSSDKIALTLDNVSWKGDKFLNFSVYLERPDLGLKEPMDREGNILSSDLPKTIQPKLMYVSRVDDEKADSGNMCDRPRFPHKCSLQLKGNESDKSSNTFLVKTTFEDGTYAAKEISVPMPEKLEMPAISEPIATPKQGDVFDVKFKDVGADSYKVEVNMCEPYSNDGINPCLDGEIYVVQKKNDVFTIAEPDVASKPVVSEKDGVIEVSSTLKLNFTASAEYYVTAMKSEIVDKVITLTEITDSKSFPVK